MSLVFYLPIVERELRVAARKRSTFWVRMVAALVALVIGSGCLVLNELGLSGAGAPSLGKALFGMLTWLSLGVALSAGLFFTSDCLSEEKREGTIGFLFLTDLRGYDVVLGKLLATSVRSFYALLAVFPVLGVTLMMGGVTGAEYWKTVLALVNALFLSLAAGLFVSALSRDSQRAMSATVLLLLLLVFGGPAGDAGLAALGQGTGAPVLSLSSPGYLFVKAGARAQPAFWLALLVNEAVAWLLLGLSCLLLPRTWQEKRTRSSAAGRGWAYRWRFGRPKRREALRRKLLALDPVVWLACRERWQAVSVWVAAVVLAGVFVALFWAAGQTMAWFFWSHFAGFVVLLLYLGVAAQAGRFFVEARRSGLFELLLATPLTEARIAQGQWRGLLRLFLLPVLVCLAAQLLGTMLVQQKTWNQLAGAAGRPAPTPTLAATGSVTVRSTTVTTVMVTPIPSPAAKLTNAPAAPATNLAALKRRGPPATPPAFPAAVFTPPSILVAVVISVGATLAVAANLVALGWFGMWMGLNSKSTNLATLKTILFVQVLPWFVMSFASAMLVGLLMLPWMMRAGPASPPAAILWFPLLMSAVATVLALAKDLGFVLFARHRLFSRLRERAGQIVAPIRLAAPPVLPRPAPPPPSSG